MAGAYLPRLKIFPTQQDVTTCYCSFSVKCDISMFHDVALFAATLLRRSVSSHDDNDGVRAILEDRCFIHDDCDAARAILEDRCLFTMTVML